MKNKVNLNNICKDNDRATECCSFAAPVLHWDSFAAAAVRGEYKDTNFVTDYQPLAYGIS